MHDHAVLERLSRANTIDAVYAACRDQARLLEFQHFLFGFRMPVPLTQPVQLILSGYPPAWRARYDEQRYMHIDPVLQRSMASTLPVDWDTLPRTAPGVARFFEEAASYGLVHGITMPVHGANAEFSLLSLARSQPLPEQMAERFAVAQRAQWFAMHVHDAIRRILLSPESEQLRGSIQAKLTAREKDCLRLVAEGATAAGIAQKLKIAESTVVYHLQRCQAKLQVGSRSQAIARAVALGELAPDCYPDRLMQSQRFMENRYH